MMPHPSLTSGYTCACTVGALFCVCGLADVGSSEKIAPPIFLHGIDFYSCFVYEDSDSCVLLACV